MQVQSFSGRNKYKTEKLLGRGTTGEVYMVHDPEDSRKYAMKVCEDKELLRQESELLRKWNHPGIPAWKDYFEDTHGYLVMEYVEGITLQKYLETCGKVSTSRAEGIMVSILNILKWLHDQTPQIVYRDLKPANVMISSDGAIRLIDLGGAIASKYQVGTYGYAAPEQFWEGIKPGPECDLYAAGKLLAYLLTGKNPCEPPYDMLKFCERNKNITPEIYRVLQRSLTVESLGRYSVAEEFIRELKAAVRLSQKEKWRIFPEKSQIVYEKCVWKSEYQRIF